jgi:tetratricopeptide (TPR) repeat protein
MSFARVLIAAATGGLLLHAQNLPVCARPPELAKILGSQPSARAFNALGGYFIQKKQTGCAIEAFESAVRLDSSSWEGHYNLGLALLEQHSSKRAAPELREAVRQRPNMPDARNALGTALANTGDTNAAEAEFKAVIQLDPKNLYALRKLTEMLIEQERYTVAVSYLTAAPNVPELQTNLAIALSKSGKTADALALLQRLVKAEPNSAVAHFNLATEQAHQKLFRPATEEYREALRLDPANDLTRLSLVKTLNILGSYDQALPLIQDYTHRHGQEFEGQWLLGEVLRGQGNYAEAVQPLRRAVLMQPHHYDAQYNLGFVLAKTNQHEEALKCFRTAVQLRPDSTQARYQLSLVLRVLNKPGEAREQLSLFDEQRQQAARKDVAAVTGGRANERLLSGDASAAVEGYRESLRSDPDNPRTLYNLAVALDRLGNRAGERDALERALRIDPKLAVVHNQLGLLNLQEGKVAEAERLLRQALVLEPQYAEAQNNLGVLYGQQGRPKEALALFRQATENNPGYSQAFLNMGLILAAQDKFADAVTELGNAVRLSPENTAALTALGMAQARLARPEQAADAFRRVIELQPKSSEAHLNLGILLADQFDLEGALAQFSIAVTLAPDSPVSHYNRGRALFDLRRYEEARTELEQACRTAPSYFGPLYLLALAEKRLNNSARAVELLEKAVQLEPRASDARYLLGRTLADLGRIDAAVAHWHKVLGYDPDHAQSLYNLARVLEADSSTEAAAYREKFRLLQEQRRITDRADTLSNFAIASAAAHDWEQAVSQLIEAVKVCGDCRSKGDLHKNLGLVYCRSGDLGHGAEQLKIAETLLPADPEIQQSLRLIEKLQSRAAPAGSR